MCVRLTITSHICFMTILTRWFLWWIWLGRWTSIITRMTLGVATRWILRLVWTMTRLSNFGGRLIRRRTLNNLTRLQYRKRREVFLIIYKKFNQRDRNSNWMTNKSACKGNPLILTMCSNDHGDIITSVNPLSLCLWRIPHLHHFFCAHNIRSSGIISRKKNQLKHDYL